MLQALAIEYWHDWVHIGEEEVDALLGHLSRHEAGSWREGRAAWRVGNAIDPILDLRGKTRLSLRFAQFADDLSPRAFGAFLLRNRIIRASQLGRGAVSTRIDPIAL